MSGKAKESAFLAVGIVVGMVTWDAVRDALAGPLEGWQAWVVGGVAGMTTAWVVSWALGRVFGVKPPPK